MKFYFLVSIFFLSSCASLVERRAAEKDYTESWDDARYYVEHKDYEKAFPIALKLSKLGSKGAQFLVANMYLGGLGTPQNPLEGASWLNVACESQQPKCLEKKREIDSLTLSIQDQIEQRTKELISLHGMKAQNVRCYKVSQTGSNMRDYTCKKIF